MKFFWLLLLSIGYLQNPLSAEGFEYYCKNTDSLPQEQVSFVHQVLEATNSSNCEEPQAEILLSGELDLSFLEVTNIELLPSLKGIESLMLRRNELRNIEPLRLMTELKRVDLSSNYIEDLSALSQLNGIVSLNLDNNNISSIDGLSGLTKLTSLSLANNSISDFKSLGGLTNLAYLDVSRKNFVNADGCLHPPIDGSGLDKVILNFKNLKGLYADNVRFANTKNIEQLKNLSHLHLTCSNIEDSNVLTALPNLFSLALDHNRLTKLSIPEKPLSILWLSLKGNYLSDLSFLLKAKKARYLDISENNFGGALHLVGFDSLYRLIASKNNLTDVKIESKSPALELLDLSHNRISQITLPDSGRTIKVLKASYNELKEWPKNLDLQKLFELYLDHNSFPDLTFVNHVSPRPSLLLSIGGYPKTLYSQITSPNIKKLYVPNSGFTDLSELPDLPKLYSLNIDRNKFRSLKGLEEKYPLLSVLIAAKNPITDAISVAALNNLDYLDLSYTKIGAFDFLRDATNLNRLYLSGNKIANVSFMKSMTNLSNLDLSKNRITDFNLPASNFRYLFSLDLRENLLQDITPIGEIENLSRLDRIGLDSNPLGTTIKKTEKNCPTTSKSNAINQWCKK